MNWKWWAAIIWLLLIAFVTFTYIRKQQWVKKDVERQMQIAALLEEAEQHGQKADTAARKLAATKASAALAHGALQEAESKLDALRRKVRNRTESYDVQSAHNQLDEADELIFALEESLGLANKTIDLLYLALDVAEEQIGYQDQHIAVLEKAWQVEHKRSEMWQQQTRRGKVKTAFLTIGATAAGGLAGYGIGAATQ